MILLNSEVNIDEIINKAVKEAIREYDKEKMVERKDKRFHNTRLLLKHYNDLKNHIKNAIDDINQIRDESDYLDILDDVDELYILSIKRSKTKTLIMLSHIDMALEMLKNKQEKLCSLEKYLALEKYYKDEKSYEDVAEELNCSVITAKRWVKEMTNELSIFLFGIEGMKFDMIQ
nr:helix-turn-helix domain-containing protein [Clostridium argentinense]